MRQYKIWFTSHFVKELRKLLHKYPHLKEDVLITLENFDMRLSDSLGQGVYKVRLKSRDLSRGKSKSFRLIVFLLEIDMTLIPITLYFKGDQISISQAELNYHLRLSLAELEVIRNS